MPAAKRFSWAKELETGVEAIDLQHRRYFELLNQLLDYAATVGHEELNRQKLVLYFDFLRNYALEHFGTEEPIMRDWQYPLFPAHHRQHQFFRERLAQFGEQLRRHDDSRALMKKIGFFAVDWFVNHIKTTDRQLAKFLAEKRKQEHPLHEYLRQLAAKIAASLGKK